MASSTPAYESKGLLFVFFAAWKESRWIEHKRISVNILVKVSICKWIDLKAVERF